MAEWDKLMYDYKVFFMKREADAKARNIRAFGIWFSIFALIAACVVRIGG